VTFLYPGLSPFPGLSSDSDDHIARGYGAAWDIPYADGTYLRLARPGRIYSVGERGECGNHLSWEWYEGTDRHFMWYCHMEDLYYVQPGEEVKKARPVGIVGDSGLSTGSHVHWAYEINGVRQRLEDYEIVQEAQVARTAGQQRIIDVITVNMNQRLEEAKSDILAAKVHNELVARNINLAQGRLTVLDQEITHMVQLISEQWPV